jgi:hypothetical protein
MQVFEKKLHYDTENNTDKLYFIILITTETQLHPAEGTGGP